MIRMIFISILILFSKFEVNAQIDNPIDTSQVIEEIRNYYKWINQHKSDFDLIKSGTIDFDKVEMGVDDQWHGEESLHYYQDTSMILKIESSRGGSYQMGETKKRKEFYIKNNVLLFYFERIINISSTPDPDFPTFGLERRIYFYNGKPFRYLRKDIEIQDLIDNSPDEENYKIVESRLSKIANKEIDINKEPDLLSIKTKY